MRKKGNEAITLNMLLGLGANDAVNTKMKACDVCFHDCIIFEEILLYTPKNLRKINDFMKLHKVTTGDALVEMCQ